MPVITVVTPSFNAARFIDLTLSSVRQQTFADFEHIVVDDGSRDETCDIVMRHAAIDPRLRLIRQENGGVALARNRGAAAADPSSRYLIFLDHDDLWFEDTLSVLHAALERDPLVSAAFGDVQRIDGEGHPLARGATDRFYAVTRGRIFEQHGQTSFDFRSLIVASPIVTPGQCLIRRAAFEGTPGFDPLVNPCDDWDMWLQLALERPLLRISPAVLKWRVHAGNTSKRYDLMRDKRAAVFRKHAKLGAIDARSFRAARDFGMYGRDAQLALTWAKHSLASADVRSAARLAARSMRLAARYVGARCRSVPLLVVRERAPARQKAAWRAGAFR